MENTTVLKGLIMGMEKLGAEYVKMDGFHAFFNIPKDSDINNPKKLQTAKNAFIKLLGVGLKIRITK